MLCVVGHISKHIREEWMYFTPIGMFPQTQHWHIPWTEVLVLFLLMLHHFCPWASLLNSQAVILALLVSSYSPYRERWHWTRPQRGAQANRTLELAVGSVYLASSPSSVQVLLAFDLEEILAARSDWKLESLLYKRHKKIFWCGIGYNSSRVVGGWWCTAGHDKQ